MSIVLPPATQQALVAETRSEEETLLTVRNVTKRFETSRHDTTALQEISLEIKKGEFICVVGPSGCGKSTLLNLIAGLDSPTSGELTFDGHAIRGPGAERVVVFQEPALYPWLNVRANVEFGLKVKGTPRGERRDIVDHYLASATQVLTFIERPYRSGAATILTPHAKPGYKLAQYMCQGRVSTATVEVGQVDLILNDSTTFSCPLTM